MKSRDGCWRGVCSNLAPGKPPSPEENPCHQEREQRSRITIISLPRSQCSSRMTPAYLCSSNKNAKKCVRPRHCRGANASNFATWLLLPLGRLESSRTPLGRKRFSISGQLKGPPHVWVHESKAGHGTGGIVMRPLLGLMTRRGISRQLGEAK